LESKVVPSDATRGGYGNSLGKPNEEYLFLCSSRFEETKIALDETGINFDYIFPSSLASRGISLGARLLKKYCGVIIDGHRIGLVGGGLYSWIKGFDYFVRLRGDIWHETSVGALSSWPNKLWVKVGDGYLNDATSILVVSKYLGDRVVSRYPSLDQKIRVIPPAIDVNHFVKKEKMKPDSLRLITVTNFHHWKKISPLIEYANQLRDVIKSIDGISIDILGGGKYLDKVAETFEQKGVNAHFRGYVDNVKEYLDSGDIYFHLSELDSFGKAVIEAQAMQLPAVVSNSGGLPETIRDKKTGFLVCNQEEFLDKLYELVENEKMRHEMGNAARNHVMGNFSPWVIGKKFVEVLGGIESE